MIETEHRLAPPPVADRGDRAGQRRFGLLMGACFAALAAWPLLAGREGRLWAIGVAALFALPALFAPAWLAHPHRWWMALADILHRLISPLMLAAIYFLVITPFSLLLRAVGKSFLSLKPDTADSYWLDRRPPGPAPQSLKNQF